MLGLAIQSVATAIEMKRNPAKYGLVNDDFDMKEKIALLLQGKSRARAGTVGQVHGGSSGGGSGGGSGGSGSRESVGGGGGVENLLLSSSGGYWQSGGSKEETSLLAKVMQSEGRKRRGTETVEVLTERLSKLELAMAAADNTTGGEWES